MTTELYLDNNQYRFRQWLNLFEIVNLNEIKVNYCFLEVKGLPETDQRDKELNQLIKQVAYEIKKPVTLVKKAGRTFLAIPDTSTLPAFEQQLIPHIVTLVPETQHYELDLGNLTTDSTPIAINFLEYALRTPLLHDRRLWGQRQRYFFRSPLNNNQTANVDAYGGFNWNIISAENGRLFLAINSTVRYVDRLWLTQRIDMNNPNEYRGRHCLYFYGYEWFEVQFQGLTGNSIKDQRFISDGQITDVFSFTKERWSENAPEYVVKLNSNSPAIIYRYPGNHKQRHGALGLCKLTVPTSSFEARDLHSNSILEPAERYKRAAKIVNDHFAKATLANKLVAISNIPLEIEPRIFNVPALTFGQGHVLTVNSSDVETGENSVKLTEFGQERLNLLYEPQVGILDQSTFDPQYILWPRSLLRKINEDFEKRFLDKMNALSGGNNRYHAKRILYNDSGLKGLHQQVNAIEEAIKNNNVQRGYVFLVLPVNAHPDLHNYIKRKLWPTVQFQCANASRIQSFYELRDGGSSVFVKPNKSGRMSGYIQNCALGMLIVNRKWLWKLTMPLQYDTYIGIDVLNRVAGITFIYNHGKDIYFRNYDCKQAEGLTKQQLKAIIARDVAEDLKRLKIKPENIIIHRDGRSFKQEIAGMQFGLVELKRMNLVTDAAWLGVVDIRKSTANHLRIFEGLDLNKVVNPQFGSAYILDNHEGIVCTTGTPFRFPGTANPLSAVVREGKLNIESVLADIFALAQLAFTAPDKCVRLPLTIKLADDFLEPIAGDANEEEALYGTDDTHDGDNTDPSSELGIVDDLTTASWQD